MAHRSARRASARPRSEGFTSMSNSKKIASVAFTGAAATAATMMAAGPALAASHFSVKNGGTLYYGPVAGKLKAGTTAVLADKTRGTTVKCKKATVSAAISKSTGTTPTKVGGVKKASWSSCTGPAGLTFRAYLAHSAYAFVSKVTTPGASGRISKVSERISGTGLTAGCRATIASISPGSPPPGVPWKIINPSHELAVNSGHKVTLRVRSATTGCLGVIVPGDIAYFTATYHISTPAALTIS